MKVVKRDGRHAEYDRNKIVVAISRANQEVKDNDKATEEQIYNIVASIENRGMDEVSVEDIQDIIEEKLMAAGKFDLAKKYHLSLYQSFSQKIQYDR